MNTILQIAKYVNKSNVPIQGSTDFFEVLQPQIRCKQFYYLYFAQFIQYTVSLKQYLVSFMPYPFLLQLQILI